MPAPPVYAVKHFLWPARQRLACYLSAMRCLETATTLPRRDFSDGKCFTGADHAKKALLLGAVNSVWPESPLRDRNTPIHGPPDSPCLSCVPNTAAVRWQPTSSRVSLLANGGLVMLSSATVVLAVSMVLGQADTSDIARRELKEFGDAMVGRWMGEMSSSPTCLD